MTDALLVLSFGGPEGPEDVRPFLENVTRGRGVPPERLDAVVEHYLHFGGVSPINALNRDIIAALEADLSKAGIDLPIYFGNRNWHPMVEETVERMREDGVRDALVFATSAWAGYSGCRQYHEDIERARRAVGDDAPHLRKLRQYYDHPLLIASFSDAIGRAAAALPDVSRGHARLVFTAHSVPIRADSEAGPAETGGHLYSRQVADAARLAAESAGYTDYDLVWQSRSGPPQVPWLEPDIVDHINELAARDVPAVIVCPIGFISDHLEVLWDLDTEAEQAAQGHGMDFVRVSTPGTDPRFSQMIVELIAEVRDGIPARRQGREPLLGAGLDGARCAHQCCDSAMRAPVLR